MIIHAEAAGPFLQNGFVVGCEITREALIVDPGDGVCLAVAKPGDAPKELFVGDTLFAGSIGRTDLPGGNYEVLIDSIRRVLFAFGDDAVVHSGHGPDTTIGRERATNPFLIM